ncbi:MAG: glycosyltransferase family 4 protein, partial [bacterium]|nr:glycosyltransferase family 4 protein [bacterium]
MRVLISAMQAGNRSGTGVHTQQLVKALLASPDAPDLRVVWPDNVPLPPGADEERVTPRHLPGILSRIRYDQFVSARDAAQLGADLIHYTANIGAVSGRLPQIVTLHDVSFLRHPEWFRADRALYYRFAASRSVRKAARVIAVSEFTANETVELLGISRDRIDVIPNGVADEFSPCDPDAVSKVRAKYATPERFFLYVGTHEPRKNLPRLIEAWSNIAADCPFDLVLAGRIGWKTAAVDRALSECGHTDRIHRCGFVDDADLPALLTAADAFAYPSLYEGFGIPVVEAMACGTPGLSSTASALPEVAGDAALLVGRGDAGAVAEGLRELA